MTTTRRKRPFRVMVGFDELSLLHVYSTFATRERAEQEADALHRKHGWCTQVMEAGR